MGYGQEKFSYYMMLSSVFCQFPSHLVAAPALTIHRQQKQHPTINFGTPGSIIYKENREEIGERKAKSLVFR